MIGGSALGEVAIGGSSGEQDRIAAYTGIAIDGGALVWLLEWEGFIPGSEGINWPEDTSIGGAPIGTTVTEVQAVEENQTFRASDVGYASLFSDDGGVRDYPPLLLEPPSIDRRFNLSPTQYGAGASWGTAVLSNVDGYWDDAFETSNIEARPARLYLGRKVLDSDRGCYKDPLFAHLTRVFDGTAGRWRIDSEALRVPLRDHTALLETPWQGVTYGGTGGADGVAEMKGRRKPRTRGAVSNITPVLVDPANLVYQWTDGPGTLVQVYEKGHAGFMDAGDYADYAALVAASVPAGQYATAEAAGLFRLGASPVGEITCDAQGAFTVAGYLSNVVEIARYVITEDMALAVELVDTVQFSVLAAAYPYTGGIYDAGEGRQAQDVAGELLAGVMAKLVPDRNGRLRPYRIDPPGTKAVAARYTTAEVIDVEPVDLPPELDPPPYRWRVGYARNYTVQTSDLSASVTDASRRALAEPYAVAQWSDFSLTLEYRDPNDPEPIVSALDTAADAEALADAAGALWGAPRRLFRVSMWLPLGTHDIGDELEITFPAGPFRRSARCVVVGEDARPANGAVTALRVLV